MKLAIYNAFLDHLSSGQSPELERVREVCAELSKDLRRELNRRNLWQASPKLVGLLDHIWTDDALAELAHDAYEHSFIRRLRGLQNHRLAGLDAVGLIRNNLRNFLTERQKDHDPIGYLVFQRTREAIGVAIVARDLAILNTPPAEAERGDVDSSTLLGFGSGLAPVATDEQLAEIVPLWSGEIFPDLVTSRTNSLATARQKLRRRIGELRDSGVEAFRFGDLVNALKSELRRRWQERVAADLGEPGTEDLSADSEPTLMVRPDDEIDGDRRLAWIVCCVTQRIVALKAVAVRDLLYWKVWPFVRSCQADDIARPPWTVISRELGISRKRLPRLYTQLGELARLCRARLDHSPSTVDEATLDRSSKDHREPIAIAAARRGGE